MRAKTLGFLSADGPPFFFTSSARAPPAPTASDGDSLTRSSPSLTYGTCSNPRCDPVPGRARIPGRSRESHAVQGRQDSNLQPAVLETAALPIAPLPFVPTAPRTAPIPGRKSSHGRGPAWRASPRGITVRDAAPPGRTTVHRSVDARSGRTGVAAGAPRRHAGPMTTTPLPPAPARPRPGAGQSGPPWTCAACASATDPSRPWTASTCASSAARSSRSSAPTAPGRPPRSRSSRASAAGTRARSACSARTPRPRAAPGARASASSSRTRATRPSSRSPSSSGTSRRSTRRRGTPTR